MTHREDCYACHAMDEVRAILASSRAPFEKLRAIELITFRPTPYRPVELGPKGWPVLQGTTAWEMHDDPETRR